MPKKKKTARRRYTTRETRRRSQAVRRALISVLIVAVVVSTVYFLVLRSNEQISIAENGIGSLFTPVQSFFSNAAGGVKKFFTDWRSYDKLQADYDALSLTNQQLSLELSNAEEALQENERLRSLLDAQSSYESLDPIYARVIARDAGQWFGTFSVNRGTNDGVTVGMAVVNGDGLVGRVYEAGLNYAKVLSIIDTRSRLSCLVQRTRDEGILRGGMSDTDNAAECSVYYLPNVNNIVPGDVVVTSGTDQIYPKGLPIGTITQISLSAGSEGNFAVVSPSVDFLHIEEVLILRQTVETVSDGANLPSVPTPTPAPTATPSPTPDASTTLNPGATEGNWDYPTSAAGLDNSPLESLPEDSWAEN